MLIIRSCPLCDTNTHDVPRMPYSKGNSNLKQCPNCDFVFLENAPDYETLETEFSWDKTFPEEKQKRRANQGEVEKFFRFLFNKVRFTINSVRKRDKLKSLSHTYFDEGYILDLGCDTGYNSQALPSGCKPIGIEIAPKLAAIAKPILETAGGRVIHDNVLSGLKSLPDSSCSGTIAKSYLEHEIHVSEVLAELQRVMAPSTHLIIKVPNFNCWNRYIRGHKWCGFRFPDHVNYFTPASLYQMLTNHGFEMVRFNLFDKLPTSDNMWCVAKRMNA